MPRNVVLRQNSEESRGGPRINESEAVFLGMMVSFTVILSLAMVPRLPESHYSTLIPRIFCQYPIVGRLVKYSN
jgi:hypothetical protein